MNIPELTSHKLSFDNGYQFVWDSTCLSLFAECPRKYYYAIIEGLAHKSTSVHLIFGSHYASALEMLKKEIAAGTDPDQALILTIRYLLIATWDSTTKKPQVFDDTKKTRLNLIRSVVWYFDEYINNPENPYKTHILKTGKAAVELSFKIEVDNGYVFSGHLDEVVGIDDLLMVKDQKTTTQTLGDWYFKQFEYAPQMFMYSSVAKPVLGSPISGVIIDAASIQINATQFQQRTITKQKDLLEDWYNSTLALIDMADSCTSKKFFPQNRTSCGNYSGCDFLPLCQANSKFRETVKKAQYTSKNWDPAVNR